MQKEIEELKSQIRDMKDYLPRLVQKIGYRSVQEFLKDFKDSQTEYNQYRIAIKNGRMKQEKSQNRMALGRSWQQRNRKYRMNRKINSVPINRIKIGVQDRRTIMENTLWKKIESVIL